MEYFKLFTLIVATFGIYIAYQQFQLAKQKNKLELFEYRVNVYEATRRLREVIIRDGGLNRNDYLEFNNDTYDSRFLFGDDVVNHIKEMKENTAKLMAYSEKSEKGSDREKFIDLEYELLTWFGEINSNSVFDKYMRMVSDSNINGFESAKRFICKITKKSS